MGPKENLTFNFILKRLVQKLFSLSNFAFNNLSLILRASLKSQKVKNLPAVQETWVRFLGQDPMNTQDWSPLGWTGWISVQSKGLGRPYFGPSVDEETVFPGGNLLASGHPGEKICLCDPTLSHHTHTWILELFEYDHISRS